MSEISNADDAFAAAASGRGHRCVGAPSLVAFSRELAARDAWIDIVETYEINEALETPRIDLGIYGDHGAYGLPAIERQVLAAKRLDTLLAALAREPATFAFSVWLDREN